MTPLVDHALAFVRLLALAPKVWPSPTAGHNNECVRMCMTAKVSRREDLQPDTHVKRTGLECAIPSSAIPFCHHKHSCYLRAFAAKTKVPSFYGSKTKVPSVYRSHLQKDVHSNRTSKVYRTSVLFLLWRRPIRLCLAF